MAGGTAAAGGVAPLDAVVTGAITVPIWRLLLVIGAALLIGAALGWGAIRIKGRAKQLDDDKLEDD